MWSIKLRYRKQWSSFEIIILGFAGVILAGALLLMLPVASREGNVTPFTETLFTATSAACVTGLSVRDTGSCSFRSVVLVWLRSLFRLRCFLGEKFP